MDNKYKRLGKNSIFVLIGNMGGRSISLLMMPFYTRWLSQADYGASEMIQCYALVLLDIISLCITNAIFIYPKQAEKKERSIYFVSGIVYSALPISIITSLLWICSKYLLPPQNVFSANFGLMMFLTVTWFLQNYIQNFVRAIDKMKVYSLTGIINTSTIAIFSALLIPRYGLTGFVIAYSIANLTTATYSFISAGIYNYVSVKIQWRYYKEMLSYSFPLVFNSIFLFASSYLNRPLLEAFHGLKVVADMAVAYKFSNIISTLIGVFFLSWQVSVMEEFGKKNYEHFYNTTWNFLFVVMMCMSIAIIPLYPFLLYIFAAPEYAPVCRYMPAIMISIPLTFYIHYSQANFLATHQSKKIVVCTTISAVASVLSNMLLVPAFGIWGVIGAQINSNIVSVCAYTWFTWKLVKVHRVRKYIFMLLCYSMLALGFAFVNTIVVGLFGAAFLAFIVFSERKALMKLYDMLSKRFLKRNNYTSN